MTEVRQAADPTAEAVLFLHAIGHFHPENVISNAFLEELGVGTDDAWIVSRVGIRTRHTVLPLDYIRQTRNRDVRAACEAALYSNAETGKRAATMALARAGLKTSDIGMVISGGCSPDECIPAEASRVAQALEIEAPAVDINAACSSFCAQLHFLTGMRPERLPDFILVVNPENSTRVVDYSDRTSSVLWGDATSAAILSPRIPSRWQVTHTVLHGSPAGADKVRVPRFGHFVQDGPAVHQFAIRKTGEVFAQLKASYLAGGPKRTASDLRLIGHQANLRMLEMVQRRGEVSAEHHFFNVDRRGNTGAAGAPSVLSENWEVLADAPAIVLAVVGSGLTWAGSLLERA